MNRMRIFPALAVLGLVTGLVLAADAPATTATTTGSAAKVKAQKEPKRKVIVYYFITYVRCQKCYNIENYTREAVETGFAKELKKGTLEMKVLNMEDAENAHFGNDYQLVTKSVVLSDVAKGRETRFKVLPKTWMLLSDKAAFMKYIQEEVRDFLKGK